MSEISNPFPIADLPDVELQGPDRTFGRFAILSDGTQVGRVEFGEVPYAPDVAPVYDPDTGEQARGLLQVSDIEIDPDRRGEGLALATYASLMNRRRADGLATPAERGFMLRKSPNVELSPHGRLMWDHWLEQGYAARGREVGGVVLRHTALRH